MLVVTGVGLCIFVFATGYMHGDTGFYRFFAYMGLFMFSMLVLVMGSNFLMMFVGWEGVGLCSYLLIGYYFRSSGSGERFAQSIHHESHRRLRFRPGDLWRDRDVRHCAIHRLFSPRPGAFRSSRWVIGACFPGLRSDFSLAPAVSRRNFRCTSGCRMRWLVQRRFRR